MSTQTNQPDSTADKNSVVVDVADLTFAWTSRGPRVLDIPTLRVERGERVFIHGPSGTGKTTLLSVLGCVVTPQSGSVRLFSQDISALGSARRDRFRADNIGFLFQMFNLIPYLSLVDNVVLPCRFSAVRMQHAGGSTAVRAEAERLLAHLELSEDLFDRKATLLSVGQQQRVAAARALIGSPGLIIADEPTSALDAAACEAFLSLLFKECEASGTTVLFVSHDLSLATLFDRQISLADINHVSNLGAKQ